MSHSATHRANPKVGKLILELIGVAVVNRETSNLHIVESTLPVMLFISRCCACSIEVIAP